MGPVCESGDVVGRDRMLTPLEVGDLVAIRDAGAYGAVMASNYNRRPLPAEVLVDNGSWRVIRGAPDAARSAGAGETSTERWTRRGNVPRTARGRTLIAFEGLDQSGKQTQAEMLRDRLREGRPQVAAGVVSGLRDVDRRGTRARAARASASTAPDVMQLLYVANRYERKPDLQRWLDGGLILVSDRYTRVEHRVRRGVRPRRLLAGRHAEVPAAGGADDIPRHQSGNGRAAEGGRTRSLRTRSGDAEARP